MTKRYAVPAFLLCLFLLAGCGPAQVRVAGESVWSVADTEPTQTDEYAGYDQTRLPTNKEVGAATPTEGQMNNTMEWQIMTPTEEAEQVSEILSSFLCYGSAALREFKGVRQTRIEGLMYYGVLATPCIAGWWEDEQYSNHILSKLCRDIQIESEEKNGYGLSFECFYADDFNRTLEQYFGAWPVKGETYTDHFINWFDEGSGMWYYPQFNIIIYGEGGTGVMVMEDIPVVTDIEKKENTMFAEIVYVINWDFYEETDEYPHEVITADNFEEITAENAKYRYAFTKAPDDGRWVILSAECIREEAWR